MKVTKTVKVPAKKETTRKVEKVYCDIPDCKDEVKIENYGSGGGRCGICKRDICKRHKVYDPDEPGDYPDKWCTICYSLYYQRRREMNERHWAEEEKLEEEVKRESLARG